MLHYTKPPRNRRLSANRHRGICTLRLKTGLKDLFTKLGFDCIFISGFSFVVHRLPCDFLHRNPPHPIKITLHISSPFREYEYLLKQFAFLHLVADRGDCDAINICSCPANNRLQTGILKVFFHSQSLSTKCD